MEPSSRSSKSNPELTGLTNRMKAIKAYNAKKLAVPAYVLSKIPVPPKQCIAEGCEKTRFARGLCSTHYTRAVRRETLPTIRVRHVDPTAIVIDPMEASWLAGFFDGEGSISITKCEPGNSFRRTPAFNLVVAMGNTDETAVRAYCCSFGGAVIPRQSATPSRRKMWYWSAGQWNALRFLNTLRPYLRVKHQQADVAGLFMATFLPSGWGWAKPVPPDLIEQRRCLYFRMMELNNVVAWRKHIDSQKVINSSLRHTPRS